MKLSSLLFFEHLEAGMRKLLPALPDAAGERWEFQRLLNFHENSATLAVYRVAGFSGQISAPLAEIHVRLLGEKGSEFLQGFVRFGEADEGEAFSMRGPCDHHWAKEVIQLSSRWSKRLCETAGISMRPPRSAPSESQAPAYDRPIAHSGAAPEVHPIS